VCKAEFQSDVLGNEKRSEKSERGEEDAVNDVF